MIQINATTWVDIERDIVATDNGAGTPLVVVVNGRTRTIPMPKADDLRVAYGILVRREPQIDPANQSVKDAGVGVWTPDRTPQDMGKPQGG
jgi:hypothetical protein